MAKGRNNRGKSRRPLALRSSRRVSINRSAHGNVREAASWVIEQTLSKSSPADTFLNGVRDRCHPRDHGLLVELVRGCLTWLRRIDHVLEQAASRPLSKIEPALLPPLRVGIYQLLYMDRVPVHAIVNEAVEHAGQVTHRGGVAFANGVLRSIARRKNLAEWPVEAADEATALSIEYSHPQFLVERWVERFGKKRTVALMSANNRRKSLHLLGFRSHGGRELAAERLIEEGLEVEGCDIAPLGLRVNSGVGAVLQSGPFRDGTIYIQDEASQLAALVPPPASGERVLDLAAAPGGKLFSMQAFQPEGQHVASDLSLSRLLRMRDNGRRLKLESPLVVADAALPPFTESFDRVVVDAPCSGTGTFRKNPELKWRVSAEEIGRLSGEGRSLMQGASRAVRPGGLLVWITCSLELEENEGVAERFLAGPGGHNFELVDLANNLPPCLSPNVVGPGSWRLMTEGDHDGFGVHVLRRIC